MPDVEGAPPPEDSDNQQATSQREESGDTTPSEEARIEERARQMLQEQRGRQPIPMEDLLPNYGGTKKLINDLMILAINNDKGAEWNQKKAQLKQILDAVKAAAENHNNFGLVFEVTKAIDEAEKIYKTETEQGLLEDDVMDGKDELALYTSKDDDVRLLSILDDYFTKLYKDLSIDQQNAIVGDLNQRADILLVSVLSGWTRLDDGGDELLKQFRLKPDVPEGLREWRVMKHFQSLERAVYINQLTAQSAIPEEIPERLSNIFRFIEGNEVSSNELGPYIQKALALLEKMPDDTEKAKEMQQAARRRLESFHAWHMMMITYEKKDMNPKEMVGVFELFEGKEEVTLEDFVARFAEDNRGRTLYAKKDRDGHAFKDENGKDKEMGKINLFDSSFTLYNERLRDERIKMNMIEEMTKFGLDGSRQHLAEIRKNVGFDSLPDEWKPKWQAEFDELREYFRQEVTREIQKMGLKGVGVGDVWGRRANGGIGITKGLIEEWHRKRTLHGAFGTVSEKDIYGEKAGDGLPAKTGLLGESELRSLLVADFKRSHGDREPTSGSRDAEFERFAAKRLLGKSFLGVRRYEMQQTLIREIETQGLHYDRNLPGDQKTLDPREFSKAELRQLEGSGFFNSVDYNAYNLTWFMAWSNYDNIRIYSPDSKSNLNDDFDSVVFHKSTSVFNGRAIDHTWEFFHDTNENRGRAKENDVNRIWKQALPGKHHYIFPQNSIAVRWAYDRVMTADQKKKVDSRVKQLMKDYDFDNKTYHDEYVSWMRSVAVMDMVENGEFFLGGRDFSEIVKAKNIGKFEMIDLFADRAKHLEFTSPQNLQLYLANPTEDKFAEINAKEKTYYSTRDARLFPWMAFALRSHWKVAHKLSLKLFDRPNLQSGGMENMVSGLVREGFVERQEGEKFKRTELGMSKIEIGGGYFLGRYFKWPEVAEIKLPRILGTTPFRRSRQFGTTIRWLTWEAKWTPLHVLFGMVAEFFKMLPGQLAAK